MVKWAQFLDPVWCVMEVWTVDEARLRSRLRASQHEIEGGGEMATEVWFDMRIVYFAVRWISAWVCSWFDFNVCFEGHVGDAFFNETLLRKGRREGRTIDEECGS